MRIAKVKLIFIFIMVLVGCDFEWRPTAKIDGEWHKQALLDGHLSHWLAVSPRQNGYVYPAFTRHWQPIPQAKSNLTFHTRLIYAFATGYRLSGDKRYLDAAVDGADFLFRYYHDAEYGGWYQSVDADGKVVDSTKDTYGHAFVIFALAHLYAVTHDARYKDAALDTWRILRLHMRDSMGGFRMASSRKFEVGGKENKRQNPVMHLFEAMLALSIATGSQEALAGIQGIGNFVMYSLLQGKADGSAYIEEWYDENWKPLPTLVKDIQGYGDSGGYIDLGHNFEWAFLLSSAETHGLGEMYHLVAQRIMDYALAMGYDSSVGGSYNRVYSDGSINKVKGGWEQAECLRVLMHFLVIRNKTELKSRYEQTLKYVNEEWIDHANGGWFVQPKSFCDKTECPNTQNDPYHMTTMHSEGIDLATAQKNAKP